MTLARTQFYDEPHLPKIRQKARIVRGRRFDVPDQPTQEAKRGWDVLDEGMSWGEENGS